jgi:hypothetical protein
MCWFDVSAQHPDGMIGGIPAARDGNHPRPDGLRKLDGHAAEPTMPSAM